MHPNGVHFAPIEVVATRSSIAELKGEHPQFIDLAGDGQQYLVQLDGPLSGYFARASNGDWEPFQPFPSMPRIAWNDPNLRFVDLTGDGHPDLLLTEDEIFTWYPSRARDGFGLPEQVRKPWDDERGPALVFADGTQSIYLADMTGDGLTDLARIRNGEVCYWPNLGYGRFGAKVTMTGAPWFDQPDQFEQRRIRLADIDGSGTTDLLYLGRGQTSFWINQCGNDWSVPRHLDQFPVVDDLASVMVIDLLGNGTACLVWSSPLPKNRGHQLRYIDLMGSRKPHLLASITNNMGAETHFHYAPSTRFYQEDRAAGTPWVTKLPFPVHVVDQVETRDWVTQTKFVSRYRYHHGYYDGVEREFRGFGMVEQWDTESFASFVGAGLFTEIPETAGEEFHLPPVHTKTWFHTGAYRDRATISRQFAHEYFRKPGANDAAFASNLLPDTRLPHAITLPDGSVLPYMLTIMEEQEACRALKGQILRQEVYADDDSALSHNPYSMSERHYDLVLLQPRLDKVHAVFFAHSRETIDYHSERTPDDPRISHQVTLEVDAWGNVTKAAALGYRRRLSLYPIETIQPYLANSILTSEIEVRNVRVPLATLQMDQEFAIRTLQKLDLPINGGINVAQNRVELYVTDRQKLDHALATAAIHLPATISVIPVKALATPEADLFGGLQINGPTLGCTSGFSVLHRASGATGILTAGHCDDTLTYLGVQLPFWGQRVAGAYDIQFNAAGTHNVRNWIYAGGANRTITGKMTWGQQAVGNFVCKQGRTTGYTCGYIVDKNYTYQGASTWIRVHRDGVNLSEGGDSGGPWFTANTAYGVHAAGVGDDAIYQATDYAEIGVSVVILTQ